MYVRGDTNDIDLLMVFLLAQNIVLSTVSTPLELPHFYFLFSFTFFLPFLLTFLTFWWCKQCAVNCVNTLGALWLCLDLWDSAPQERNLGRPSCGIYCLSRLFVYLLATFEYEEFFFFKFVKRPLSSPTLFWTVIVQVLTAGTQESGKKIREIFLPCGKKNPAFYISGGLFFFGRLGWVVLVVRKFDHVGK